MMSDAASWAPLCLLLALAAFWTPAKSTTAPPDATVPQGSAITTAGPSQLPIKVDVLGQSGKFTVYPENKGPQSGIQVIMDALREVDWSGGTVGTQGNNKHSIQTFASQTFTINPMVMEELSGGVSAAKISFQSSVSTIGKIGIDTYVVAGRGIVGPQGETWAVRPGDLKWNIRIWDWKFCDGSGAGACRANDVGEYIELDVSVKGLTSPSKRGNKTIDLGGQTTLELSNQVFVDNSTWSMLANGYPAVTVQGSTTTITFRFRRFNSSILYDPVMGTSSLIEGNSGASTTKATEGWNSGASTTKATEGWNSGASTTKATEGWNSGASSTTAAIASKAAQSSVLVVRPSQSLSLAAVVAHALLLCSY